MTTVPVPVHGIHTLVMSREGKASAAKVIQSQLSPSPQAQDFSFSIRGRRNQRMKLLNATTPGPISIRILEKSDICCSQKPELRYKLAVPITASQSFQCKQSISYARRLRTAALVCAAALNARCAAEQTQTVQRQSTTISNAPIQNKEKSPELDDGGTGFPPRDDDGGGGGGGGGGPNWSGGFFFFGLLAFLGMLKDQETEGPYRDNKRR